MEQDTDPARQAFESNYGMINTLDKWEDGTYQDWNLERTWKCWKEAWAIAKTYYHGEDN